MDIYQRWFSIIIQSRSCVSWRDSLLGLFGLIWSSSFQRAAHLEDGAELPMKFEPFPPHLLGKPVEEIDQFVYEKVSNTTCNCELVPYYCRHKTGKLFQSFPNMRLELVWRYVLTVMTEWKGLLSTRSWPIITSSRTVWSRLESFPILLLEK